MATPKNYKKGEVIFKEGDRLTSIYFIQSGLVSVQAIKGDKKTEICQLATAQVVGEEALFASAPKPMAYSAIALNDTVCIEVPIPGLVVEVQNTPQLSRLLMKSLSEKEKSLMAEIKSLKQERDTSACPPENVSKVFGVIFHVANFIGEKKKDAPVRVNWPNFKKYAQRIFLESPVRLEQAIHLLVKLKLATMEMVKDPTDPEADEELGFVHFPNLPLIEKFFDFYQNHFYRGGANQILKVDEKIAQTVRVLLEVTEKAGADRAGVTTVPFKDTIEQMQKHLGASFNGDALRRIEQKGLLFKQQANAQGATIAFFRTEYLEMIEHWKILREIDKWNEKGFVEMEEAKPVLADGKPAACPSCKAPFTPKQKFCGECGFKLEGSQAA
jgi:CRP-like cAMP-binding protein